MSSEVAALGMASARWSDRRSRNRRTPLSTKRRGVPQIPYPYSRFFGRSAVVTFLAMILWKLCGYADPDGEFERGELVCSIERSWER